VVAVALSSGEAILLIALASIPVAVISFALGARGALRGIGRGPLSIEQETPGRDQPAPISPRAREEDIRQMLEAKAYRQRRRGEAPLDVELELEALLDEGGGELGRDAELVAEVRQLVIARNERRQRQGKQPLDVESEVERQLRELENLGQ